MERRIMQQLLAWKTAGQGRLPLLLYGARQVGKTYVLREFGQKYFDNVVYVNFESDTNIRAFFEVRLTPEYLLAVLAEQYKVKIEPERTLLIFDEIQSCERALTSLKYFAELAPEYCVVAAGSLLGVAVNRESFSFPVGKVKMLHLYPLDLEEFLWAKGQRVLTQLIRSSYENDTPLPGGLHEEALSYYREYLLTGGMPSVVLAHLAGQEENEVKQNIYNSYIADMAKYAERGESVKIAEAYHSLPAQLAKENKKFQYKLIKKGARSSLYGHSLDWLIQAGIALKCTKCEQGMMPLAAYEDLSSFKLYFSDLGLLAVRLRLAGLQQAEQFSGALTENYLAITLRSKGYDLYYWESKGIAELDFLLIKNGRVVPLECKANVNVKAKSLMTFMKKYEITDAIRISARNFGCENGIKSIPLYAAFCL